MKRAAMLHNKYTIYCIATYYIILFRINPKSDMLLADNIPGSLSVTRQGAGYVPTKTVRIAVKSDGTVITAFPYNPAP